MIRRLRESTLLVALLLVAGTLGQSPSTRTIAPTPRGTRTGTGSETSSTGAVTTSTSTSVSTGDTMQIAEQQEGLRAIVDTWVSSVPQWEGVANDTFINPCEGMYMFGCADGGPLVTSLFVKGNLSGHTLPSEIGLLPGLRELNVAYGTSIHGTLPSSFSRLSALTRISATSNLFVSTLPTEWGDMAAIKYLDLEYQSIVGTLPTEWGRLSTLESLYLEQCNVSGSIPTEWAGMTNLGTFFIADNNLTGPIPDWMELRPRMCDIGGETNRYECVTPPPGPCNHSGYGGPFCDYALTSVPTTPIVTDATPSSTSTSTSTGTSVSTTPTVTDATPLTSTSVPTTPTVTDATPQSTSTSTSTIVPTTPTATTTPSPTTDSPTSTNNATTTPSPQPTPIYTGSMPSGDDDSLKKLIFWIFLCVLVVGVVIGGIFFGTRFYAQRKRQRRLLSFDELVNEDTEW